MRGDLSAKLLDEPGPAEGQPDNQKSMREFTINSYAENQKLFCNNKVTTNKYNLIVFSPRFAIWRNLWEQFHRYANVYFLVITTLQLIPGLSPTGRYTTLIPLTLVLFVSFLKDTREDWKRYVRDKRVNKQKASVYRTVAGGAGDKWRDVEWQDICVGDFVKVARDGEFPADLLLLWLDNEDKSGICHIETKNLDGEANLKPRRAHTEPAAQTTSVPAFDPQNPAEYEGVLACKPPDDDLYRFEGYIERTEKDTRRISRAPIDVNSILLRGARLGGATKSVIGVVVYTGCDTKLMKNQKDLQHKSSRLERETNRQILFIFGVLIVLCILSAVLFHLAMRRLSDHWYLQVEGQDTASAAVASTGTFLILFNNLIPISLYVSMEIVRLFQGTLIESDVHMYTQGSPAETKTSGLNEELGQVQYVFSDKTGTLTCNVMDFLKFSIGYTAYGTGTTEIGRAVAEREGRPIQDEERPPTQTKGFCFYDERISDVDGKGEHWRWMDQENREQLLEFFRILAVCHDGVVAQQRIGDDDALHIEYQGQSPDEQCLVNGVRHLGVEFHDKVAATHETVLFIGGKGKGKREVWKEEHVLGFTSERKRMSVVVKTPQGKRLLLCKGADTVIFERLKKNVPQAERDLREQAKRFVGRFAADGLRTLVVAKKELDQKEYDKWAPKFAKAAENVGDRESLMAECADEIEREMDLVGTTAIEDKLQDGVPATIELLRTAGIQIWVLTGDKQETAINIGFACALLHNDMGLFTFDDGCDSGNITQVLQNYARDAEAVKRDYGQELGIIVQGSTLLLILGGKGAESEPRPENSVHFLNIAKHCKVVICCRVTPGQKAQMVTLVKRNLDKVTMAIGDGANDVSMIGEAHVGVGISGHEGLQAVRAADYAISQFRFLQRLLLVHGRWSYRRLAKLILYSFYKNICLQLTQFWFCIFNSWSGQSLYDPWALSMFNVVFTSLPIMFMAVLDRDVEPKRLVGWDKEDGSDRWKSCPGIEQFPELYDDGRKGRMLDARVFWQYSLTAVWHSIVCFFVPALSLMQSADASSAEPEESNGAALALPTQGLTGYTAVVFVVTLKVALETNSWTFLNFIVTWGSILAWFLFLLIYCDFFVQQFSETQDWYLIYETLGNPQVWLAVLLSVCLALLRDFAWKVYRFRMRPTLRHKIREWEKRGDVPEFNRHMLKADVPRLFPRQMVKHFKKKPVASEQDKGHDLDDPDRLLSGCHNRPQEQLEHLANAQLHCRWAEEYASEMGARPEFSLPERLLRRKETDSGQVITTKQRETHIGRAVQRPPALTVPDL